MWWGGTHPEDTGEGGSSPRVVEPEPELSSEGSGSPPVDLMAEEDDEEATRTIGAEDQDDDDDDEDSGDDFGELHEKFAAQEKLLGELRGVLKSNSEKLETKEKEYADRLSFSRPGYYGSSSLARSSSTPVVIPRHDDSVEGSGSRPSRLQLFKKELDEARIKENEEIQQQKNLEKLVRQLQFELAERDKMISSLREDAFSVTSLSFAGSPANSPYVMSPERGSPTDMSPNRTPPLGCSVDSAASYSGFSLRSYGDSNRYLELSERNIELERKIMDLEENLREKDELIRARTQAVTLMSADLSAKGRSTLDQLEETRVEMKKMQTNFAEKEAEWREQMTILKRELVSKDKKLQSIEDSFSRLEKTRFELSTKNASLQEKVVMLQTDVADRKRREQELVQEKEEKEEISSRKILNLERRLELAESSRSVNLEKFLDEVRGVVSDSELSEKMVEIQNQVAELEEEKGNLQLKLVEYEELAARESKCKTELKEMSSKLSSQEDQVEQHIRTIEKLESEKADLAGIIQRLEENVSHLSIQVSDLESSGEELSESKVRLEMRAVDLEEQRDRALDEAKELEVTITNLKSELKEQHSRYTELKQEHSEMVVEYHKLEGSHSKYQSTQKLFDRDFLEKTSKIKELTISVAQLEKVIEQKNVEIGETLSILDHKQNECRHAQEQVEILQKDVEEKGLKIISLSSLLDESAMNAHLKMLSDQVSELQLKVQVLEEEKVARLSEVDQLREALNQSEHERGIVSEQLGAVQEALKNVESTVQELREQSDKLLNEKTQLAEQLSTLTEEKEQLIQEKNRSEEELSNLNVQVSEIQSFVDELSASKSLLETQMSELEVQRDQAQQKLSELEISFNKLNSDLEEQQKLYGSLHDEHSGMVSEFNKLEHDHSRCQVIKRELEREIEENEKQIKDLRQEVEVFQRKTSELETAITDQNSQFDNVNRELEERSLGIEDQQSKRKEDEARLSLLSDQLEVAKSEIDSMKMRLNESEQDIVERSNTITDLKSRIAELESQAVAVQTTVPPVAVDSDNDGWSEKFDGFGTEEIVVAVEAFEQSAPAVEQEHLVQSAASADLEAVKAELAQALSELEEVRAKLLQAEHDKEEQMKLVNSLNQVQEAESGWTEDFDGFGTTETSEDRVDKTAFDAVKAELEETRLQLESAVSKLKISEEKNEARVSSLKTQVATLENQLQEAGSASGKDGWSEDFDVFGADEQVSKCALDAVASELEETRSEVESLRSRLGQAEQESNHQKSLVETLKNQVATLEAAQVQEGSGSNNDGWAEDFDAFGDDRVDRTVVDALQSELDQTQSESEALRSKLISAEQENEKQSTLVEKLKSQVAELEARLQDSSAPSNNDGWTDDFEGFGSDDVVVASEPNLAELQTRLEESLQQQSASENVVQNLERNIAELEARKVELEDRLKNQSFENEHTLAELRRQLDEEQRKVFEQESSISTLNQDLEKLTLKLNEVDEQKTDQVREHSAEIATLKTEIAQKEEEKESWSRKESQLMDKLRNLESGYNQLVSQQGADVQSVIAERDRAKAKSDLLTDKCKKLLAKAKQLETKTKENEVQLSQASSKIEALTQELNSVRDEISVKADLILSLESDIKTLKEKENLFEEKSLELESATQSLAEIRSQLNALEAELSESRVRNEELSIELVEREKAYTDLSTQLDSLIEENSKKDDLLNSLNADKDALGKEIEELESAALDLKKKLGIISTEKSQLEESAKIKSQEQEILVGELQNEILEKDSIISELKNQAPEKEEVVSELRSEKEAVQNELSVVVAQRDTLTSENETLKVELFQSNEERDQLRSEITKIESSTDQLKEEIESKNEKVQKLEEEINRLNESLTSYRHENEEMSSKLISLEEEKTESERALEQLKTRVVQMGETLEELKEERANFEEELQKKQTLLDSMQANSGLQEQVSAHRSQLDAKEREISSLKEQVIEQLEDELSGIRQELQDRSEDLVSARIRIEQLESELADRNSQLEQLRAEERPLDVADFNRPPPDVTQYQGVPLHPDVAHHSTASVQPDIMPQYTFQGEAEQDHGAAGHDIPFYQMMPDQQVAQGGADGWNDAGWGEPDDWFAGVQQHSGDHQPAEQHQQQQQQLPELFQQHQHPEVFQQQQATAADWFHQQHHQQVNMPAPPAASVEELNSLREQLNANAGELISLRDSLTHKNEECSRLEQNLSQLKNDSEYLRQMLGVKEEECSGLKTNLALIKADFDLAQSTYSQSVEGLRVQHSQEIETLQNESRTIGQDKEALEAELQISEQECKELKDKLVQMEQRINQLESNRQGDAVQAVEPAQEDEAIVATSAPSAFEASSMFAATSSTSFEIPSSTFAPLSSFDNIPTSSAFSPPTSAGAQSPPTATSYFTWDDGSVDDPFSIAAPSTDLTSFAPQQTTSDAFTSFAPSQTWPVQQDHYNFDQNQHQHVNQMWQPDQAVDQHQQQQVWQPDQAVDQHQQQQVWQQHHQVDDRQERITDLERQVAELKASLENSDQTRQALENELLPEKERLIKNLESQLLYLQTSFESSDLARQSLEHEMSQLPTWSQMDALKEEKEGLEELIANNQEKIEDLQTKVTQLESTLETYSTTKNNLEEERNRLIQQISFFENQDHTGSEVELKSLTDKLNHLETINSDLNRQMESYSLNMNSLEEERNRLIQQITEFESQQSNGNVDLREKLSLLETTNQDLIRQLEELKAIPKPDQTEEPFTTTNVKKELFETEPEETPFATSSYFSADSSHKEEEVAPFVPADIFQASSANQDLNLPQQHQQQQEIKSEEEVVQQQQPSDDNTAWYLSELNRYQQAIADWQSWADNQNTEFANLQTTLTQYIEAYNAVTAELTQLQAAQSAQPPAESVNNSQKDEEIAKLKAAVRAKGIEIEDLMETVDRLRSEKEDLEQEMRELSTRNEHLRVNNEVQRSSNLDEDQDLGSLDSDSDYFALYEEMRANYEVVSEQKEKFGREVIAIREDMATQKRSWEGERNSLEVNLRDAESKLRGAESKLRDAESRLGDLEKQSHDLTLEKSRLLDRIDSLEAGNERFFEMKEKQDKEIELLKSFESDWKRRHDSLQWQLTEMEQQMETQKANVLMPEREKELLNRIAKLQEENTNTMGQNLVLKNNQDASFKEQASLKMEVLALKFSANEAEQKSQLLQEQLRDAEVLALNLKQEKDTAEAEYNELKSMFDTANECLEMLQNVQIERDQLAARVEELVDQVEKLESENLSQKTKLATYERESKRPIQEYADFQNLNQKLQNEIESLRGYIDDQQTVITELQQHNSPFTSHSSQDTVVHLQKQVQEKNAQLSQLQSEIESYKKSRDESDADRENEIRKFFDPSGSEHQPEADVSLENERLKNDLNQCVRENRQLTRQLDNWKRQLTSFDGDSGGQGRVFDDNADDDDYDEDEENSPVVLRQRQEQAYRSVAALQLRVEELTLEVTKLLEERDTLQLKLSNVMRQFERQKESASRASTARSTPVPWMPFVDNAAEVRELRMKIEELGKLNYALDIELQKEREGRSQMQARLTGTPRRALEQRRLESSSSQHSSPGGVIHL